MDLQPQYHYYTYSIFYNYLVWSPHIAPAAACGEQQDLESQVMQPTATKKRNRKSTPGDRLWWKLKSERVSKEAHIM